MLPTSTTKALFTHDTCLFLRVIETLLGILHLPISIGMNRRKAGLAFEDLSRHPGFIIFVRNMWFPAAWCVSNNSMPEPERTYAISILSAPASFEFLEIFSLSMFSYSGSGEVPSQMNRRRARAAVENPRRIPKATVKS